jgi:hypothetical protein
LEALAYDFLQSVENPTIAKMLEEMGIEMEWADEPEEGAEEYMIFFALDPTVSGYKSHWYDW